jgi:hypothetical protein
MPPLTITFILSSRSIRCGRKSYDSEAARTSGNPSLFADQVLEGGSRRVDVELHRVRFPGMFDVYYVM